MGTDGNTLPLGAEMIIAPRTSDIGAFEVQRLLPYRRRRMVGPFIFADQMGPTVLRPETPMVVRAHPHIGLSTVTYLLEGEIVHRDSLGHRQTITPGAVNLMTAGRGIVHSERSDPDSLAANPMLHGMQIWLAAPKALEEGAPDFKHYPPEVLPLIDAPGVTGRLVIGSALGLRSPIQGQSETLYIDLSLAAGATTRLPDEAEERAFLVLGGAVTLNEYRVASGDLIVLTPRAEAVLRAEEPARIIVLGGAVMDGPRHIWWNFVSSSRERIEQAKEDWRAGRFAEVAGESDPMPLPE